MTIPTAAPAGGDNLVGVEQIRNLETADLSGAWIGAPPMVAAFAERSGNSVVTLRLNTMNRG